jgi:hypothetical protein
MGNVLRLVRRGSDAALAWLAVPGSAEVTVFASAQKDLSSPSLRATVPTGTASWVESGAIGDGKRYFYHLAASACPP